MEAELYHYTDRGGYNSIVAHPTWRFRASQPPGNPDDHPFGAYFTDYPPGTKNLALKLRIPRSKLEFAFRFRHHGGLTQLPNSRGLHICYSTTDYLVPRDRQIAHGETGL